MLKKTCIALHGFLGLPSDWNFLKALYPQLITPAIESHQDLDTWALAFNKWALNYPEPRILIGYSMGGRLALHALLQKPQLWTSTYLISTHPGLQSEIERKARLQKDIKMSEKFLHSPWIDLMKEWESQDVFKNSSFRFDRSEKDFSRKLLSSQIQNYSLGRQKDFRIYLNELDNPVHWITGANDLKYSLLAKEVSDQKKMFKHTIIQAAFHRAPWEQKKAFLEILRDSR